MPTDEFGPLKKVFGFEDPPPAEKEQTCQAMEFTLDRATLEHAGVILDPGQSSVTVPDGMVAFASGHVYRGPCSFRCSDADRPKVRIQTDLSRRGMTADEVRQMQLEHDRRHSAAIRQRHQRLEVPHGPLTIEPSFGSKCELQPARLFQLRDDLIVHIDQIISAERIRAGTVVEVRLGEAIGRVVRITDDDGSLWRRLQMAATNVIILNPASCE